MISSSILSSLKTPFFKAIIYFSTSLLLIGCNGRINNEPVNEVKTGEGKSYSTAQLREVTFLPYWVTSAQFAGYYVAEETGIYKKHGIRLRIIPYQQFITYTDLIKEGKVDFATLWLVNAIQLKAAGADIVNIAQLSSRSSLMLVTKKKSGIRTLMDMNGKRAGIWSGFELQPKALFKKYHLDVKIVPIGSTNNLFLLDGVDITNASWFDEYHSIINSGYNPDELNTFFFADYGLNFLEDGIYCLSDKMKNEPELCREFVQATLEGWEFAFNNPQKAIDIVVKYAQKARQSMNRVHQRWMLDRYKDLYIPKGKTIPSTVLSEKDFLFVCNVLRESDLIKQIPAFKNFYHPAINR
jgi:NitT/TauT family transport system substrate-binding protein